MLKQDDATKRRMLGLAPITTQEEMQRNTNTAALQAVGNVRVVSPKQSQLPSQPIFTQLHLQQLQALQSLSDKGKPLNSQQMQVYQSLRANLQKLHQQQQQQQQQALLWKTKLEQPR